jgi:hypothetical protein
LSAGGQLIQTVHIDDLASAIQAGVRQGLAGIVTVAEREPVSFRELLAETARLLGRRVIFVPVPYRAVDLAMRVAGLLRVRLPVSSDNLAGLRGLEAQDVGPDLQRLGIEVRDYRASLRAILFGAGQVDPARRMES